MRSFVLLRHFGVLISTHVKDMVKIGTILAISAATGIIVAVLLGQPAASLITRIIRTVVVTVIKTTVIAVLIAVYNPLGISVTIIGFGSAGLVTG